MIPGHKMFKGNEKTNKLAKKGAAGAGTYDDIEAPVSIGLKKWLFEANSN